MNNAISNQFSDSVFTLVELLAVAEEWSLGLCPRDESETERHAECERLASILGDSPTEFYYRLFEAVQEFRPPARRLLVEDRNYSLWAPLASDPGIDTGIDIARRYNCAILGFCLESTASRSRGDKSLMIAVVLEDDSIMPMYRHSAAGWVEF